MSSKFESRRASPLDRRRRPWKSHGKAQGQACTLTKLHATLYLGYALNYGGRKNFNKI